MKKPLFLFFVALVSLSAHAQSHDSLYSVRLTDGSTIHTNNIQLVNSFTQGKYLRLDNNRQISLSQVRDFNGQHGTFAIGNINGQYDVYKLETEGPRISLYSQCSYETETVFTSVTPGGPNSPPPSPPRPKPSISVRTTALSCTLPTKILSSPSGTIPPASGS